MSAGGRQIKRPLNPDSEVELDRCPRSVRTQARVSEWNEQHFSKEKRQLELMQVVVSRKNFLRC